MKRLINTLILSLGLATAVLAQTTLQTPSLFVNSTLGTWEAIESKIKYSAENLFILNWAGRGGIIYMGIDFINSLVAAERQGKYIVIKVVGNTYSMHSLSLCFASEVRVMHSNIFFMYHSAGDRNHRADNSQYKWMFDECVRRGYAPSNVYQLVQQGYEVYYYPVTKTTTTKADPRVLE